MYISDNHSVNREHSFVTDNTLPSVCGILENPRDAGIKPGEGFPAFARDEMGNIIEEFKGVVIRDGYKSVLVSNDYNPIPFEWNCSVEQNAVANSNYDPNTNGGTTFAQGLSCKSCNRSTRQWWWSQDGITFAKLTEEEFQNKFQATHIGGWIASCEET